MNLKMLAMGLAGVLVLGVWPERAQARDFDRGARYESGRYHDYRDRSRSSRSSFSISLGFGSSSYYDYSFGHVTYGRGPRVPVYRAPVHCPPPVIVRQPVFVPVYTPPAVYVPPPVIYYPPPVYVAPPVYSPPSYFQSEVRFYYSR